LVKLYLFWLGNLIFINIVFPFENYSQLYLILKVIEFPRKLLDVLHVLRWKCLNFHLNWLLAKIEALSIFKYKNIAIHFRDV